jgi:hypothetical protein
MQDQILSASRRLSTLGLGFALLATPALANPDSKAEQRQERVELHESKKDLRDDRQDLAQLERLVEDWHRARSRRDRGAETQADQSIDRWVQKEIAEARTEVREAQTEVQESKSEVRNEQQDAQRAARHGNHRKAANERAEVRADKADLADDKRDLTQQRNTLSRLHAVAKDLESIQHHFRGRRATPAQYARKSQLLRQLQTLASDEARDSKTEIREDQRELREGQR